MRGHGGRGISRAKNHEGEDRKADGVSEHETQITPIAQIEIPAAARPRPIHPRVKHAVNCARHRGLQRGRTAGRRPVGTGMKDGQRRELREVVRVLISGRPSSLFRASRDAAPRAVICVICGSQLTRSVVIGSTAATRRAGISPAASVTASKVAAAAVNTTKSNASMTDRRRFEGPRASSHPAAPPERGSGRNRRTWESTARCASRRQVPRTRSARVAPRWERARAQEQRADEGGNRRRSRRAQRQTQHGGNRKSGRSSKALESVRERHDSILISRPGRWAWRASRARARNRQRPRIGRTLTDVSPKPGSRPTVHHAGANPQRNLGQ